MDSDQLKDMEKEGVEAPSAEVVNPSARKSSRLQSKKSSSPFSKYLSKSSFSKKPSKTSPCKEKSVTEGKIQEEIPHGSETNSVLTSNTTSMKSSTIPSFEYQVESTKGIRLVVDLNWKRSDWMESMKKEVLAYHNHPVPAVGTFRKEIKRLSEMDNRKVSSQDEASASDANLPISGHKRKKHLKSDHIHGQSPERILRSTPVLGGKVVEHDGVTVRRSSRVQSK